MTSRHTWSFVGGAGGGQECYDGQDDGYGVSEVSSRVEACQEQPQRSAAAGGRWQPMGMDSTDGARAWTPPPFWSTHPHIAKPTFWPPPSSGPTHPDQFRSGTISRFSHSGVMASSQSSVICKLALNSSRPSRKTFPKQLSWVLLFFKYFCRLCEINICGMQSPG